MRATRKEQAVPVRVLVIEDDPVLGPGLKAGLEHGGFRVRLTEGVTASNVALTQETPDAILLDLGLPDGEGLAFLAALRRGGDRTPVMIVTAAGQRETRLAGLDGGADDYITKPYDLDEVIARLRALLRRTQGVAGNILPFGPYALDLAGQVVQSDTDDIMLTQREFRVLSLLVRRAGRWVSKSDIEYSVYEDAVDIDSNTIEAAIYGLRKKLGAQIILTARGLGYMVTR